MTLGRRSVLALVFGVARRGSLERLNPNVVTRRYQLGARWNKRCSGPDC